MKIENQCCSLELAKRLKELGVAQKSFAFWEYNRIAGKWEVETFSSLDQSEALELQIHAEETRRARKEERKLDWQPLGCYAAFTVAELGVALRGVLPLPTWQSMINEPDMHRYQLWMGGAKTYCVACHETEAGARAEVLIYALENGFTTAEKVNALLAAA